MSEKVTMTCMTTKQKFEVEDAPVIVLANGRYAYRVKCPWEGKAGKELFAFKFCSAAAHRAYVASQEQQEAPEEPDEEQQEAPEDSDEE
jgi:hypothetical protein